MSVLKPDQIHHLEKLIDQAHADGLKLRSEISDLMEREKRLEANNRQRRRELARLFSVDHVIMYDSTEISTIPNDARAVAGYVGGAWPDYRPEVARFPRAIHLSIAINSHENAECLDVENGDASPFDAPAWVRRQQARGVKFPKLYANLSTMPVLIKALKDAGIKREEVRLWVAHYDDVASVPAGFDGKQYFDRALNKNLDISICLHSLFD